MRPTDFTIISGYVQYWEPGCFSFNKTVLSYCAACTSNSNRDFVYCMCVVPYSMCLPDCQIGIYFIIFQTSLRALCCSTWTTWPRCQLPCLYSGITACSWNTPKILSEFWHKGLCVSLSTDDPTQFHYTKVNTDKYTGNTVFLVWYARILVWNFTYYCSVL